MLLINKVGACTLGCVRYPVGRCCYAVVACVSQVKGSVRPLRWIHTMSTTSEVYYGIWRT